MARPDAPETLVLLCVYGLAAVVVVVDVGAAVAVDDSVTVTTVVGWDEGLPSVDEQPDRTTTATTADVDTRPERFIVYA
ncbi:hypothetical protein [Williamsia maris]|uniref:hypothetical protein n=1 Tax=Williamsia maris TaxID=72806 RepID=UPI0020A2CBBD|nr:hypothetical protein [Williamsia maris]